MEAVHAVILLALLQYIVLTARVGFARGRTGIEAPAVTGNEEFERHYRVQMNTLEQLIIFIPGCWLFAMYVHAYTAAGLGVVYLVGRTLYAIGYVKAPETRGTGMLLTVIPSYLMVLGGLVGIAWELIK